MVSWKRLSLLWLPSGGCCRLRGRSSGAGNQFGLPDVCGGVGNAGRDRFPPVGTGGREYGSHSHNGLFEPTGLDGSATRLSSSPMLPPSGQVARFVDELFPTLTTPFQGILRITTTPDAVASIGLRLRINECGDVLTTTTPPANEAAETTSAELIFPHLVDTGGWTTQFILFSGVAGQSSSGSMTFVSQSGAALGLVVR